MGGVIAPAIRFIRSISWPKFSGPLVVCLRDRAGECLENRISMREGCRGQGLLVDLSVDFGEDVESTVVPILLLLGGWIRSLPWLLVSFLQNGFEVVCVIRSLKRD